MSSEMTLSEADFNKFKWLNGYLTHTQVLDIEQAIADAELKTSAEIVPVVVRQSINVSHVPLCLFLILALISFALASSLAESLNWQIWQAELILLALSWLGGAAMARLPQLQRVFVSQYELEGSVARRAELEFYSSNIRNTVGSTGVLIFISLLEHRVVVLADKEIARRLPNETWAQAVTLVVGEIKKGQLSTGLHRVIQTMSETLSSYYPAEAHNPNELANRLVIRES